MARPCPRWTYELILLLLNASIAFAAGPTAHSREEMKAAFEAHKGDFDYLLGDWQFTSENRDYGKGHGDWIAVKLADGQVVDRFRILGDKGEVYYTTFTLRAWNGARGEWDLVSLEGASGLQNTGTGKREGAEVHIEQTFGVASGNPSVLRIRYYDIGADHFSWAADRSNDGGKTWTKDFQKIEAHRTGPPHTVPLLEPQK